MKIKDRPKLFNEMVIEAQQRIHLGLLEDGIKGMREAIHLSFCEILKWNEDQDIANKKVRKKK